MLFNWQVNESCCKLKGQRILAALLLVVVLAGLNYKPAVAQFYPTQYRPPHQNWQQLSTHHFKILFPAGQDSTAYRAAHILEKEYGKVQELTGGKLRNFPVILNGYNDLSNGFVTPLHFRSEIYISPEKGKTLNPKNGGWLENVLPHELTHALQFSHLGGFGVGQIINVFSPDLARALQTATPSGVQEGLAVFAESKLVAAGGGRGNYPFFTNRFKAIFNSPLRWSLGQMVQAPAYNRPFNRNYLGGYEFTEWLQNTYGQNTSRKAIDFNIRLPFLGYGIALKHVTGKWPEQLFEAFERQKEETPVSKKQAYTPLPIHLDGPSIRRPKWLSDSSIIFYGSFYNAKPGFYRYNLKNKSLKRLVSTGSVANFNYTLSGNRQTLVYSYYNPNLLYTDDFRATLVKASLHTGEINKIYNHQRLYAPVFAGDSTLLALQTNQTHASLVSLQPGRHASIDTIFTDDDYQIKSMDPDPQHTDSLAVVMNHHGNQALWIASKKSLKSNLTGPPTISFKGGSVFDPQWNTDGNRLLFSSDFTGILQIYEYSIKTGTITQLTNVPYNAFEASYSPNGKKIAFVIQRKNQRLPVVLSRDEFWGKVVHTAAHKRQNAASPGLKVSTNYDSTWSKQSYSTGFSWLKPRTVLPAFKEISGSNRYRFGAGIHSNDLLQQQAYSLEGTTTKGRLFYDLTYRNKQFFPGLRARIFSRPAFRRFRFQTKNGSFGQTFLRQERSFALSVPMQFTLKENVQNTSVFVEPELRLSQLRYFNREGNNPSDFSNAVIGKLSGQFNYRLQQDIRSLQPNSGFLLYAQVEHYFSSGSLSLNTANGKAPLDFAQPTALEGGIYGYVSPFRRWNQSLRLGVEGVTQDRPIYDNQAFVSDGFAEDIFPFAPNLLSFSSRYTLPLLYPDKGGFLVPLYLSSIYLVGFTDTVVNPDESNSLSLSRTVVGGGVRFRFRLSNLSLDIGLGIGVEPSRGNTQFFVGGF